MSFHDLKRYVSKVRNGMTGLFQKARVEPEYRRLAILTVVLLATTTILSPLLGMAIILIAAWYLTY